MTIATTATGIMPSAVTRRDLEAIGAADNLDILQTEIDALQRYLISLLAEGRTMAGLIALGLVPDPAAYVAAHARCHAAARARLAATVAALRTPAGSRPS
jgi:hypothetical protein